MTSTGSGSSGNTGGKTGAPNGERMRESADSGARVQAVHTGLKKVVTGRESVIKDQAVKLAEKLDVKTAGRHHQKIRLALLALNSLVDTLGKDGKTESEAKGSPRPDGAKPAGASGRSAPSASAHDEPEDIGTFTPKADGRSK
ncbi:hypothetical protein C5B85_03435 [Pseudoclavibacter sp. AY1F1]|uniref:hypothetical protein n=1 Tax=Pseudoclavibacter sp. AY1F1 TaxID=2080583 RepID=UPI000CE82551|nr:hypothetical protein [Pseudoclavibacter sp. AY1F1]PPF47323.1 hypothetical protein C5B85_03435 [Pseudoclavibacter sp. AY1F1]